MQEVATNIHIFYAYAQVCGGGAINGSADAAYSTCPIYTPGACASASNRAGRWEWTIMPFSGTDESDLS